MPQNPTNITDSTEFKEFCKKNNLEVYDFDALKVLAFKQQEMIMEIAKNIKSPDIQQINENWNLEVTYWWTLFDKWNNKWTSYN